MRFYRLITLLAALFTVSSAIIADDLAGSDSIQSLPKYIHHIGADIRGGYVASSVKYDQYGYEEGASMLHSDFSGHIKYSFSYSGATRTGRLYPGVYQGVGLGVNTFFDNQAVGTPVLLYAFQGAPVVRLSRDLTLDYEWNFGGSFGWRKFDEYRPPVNLIVGSKVNAYINLGFMLRYRISDRMSLTAGLDMAHYSNGNTSWPNPGVNTIGGRIGAVYTLNPIKNSGSERLFPDDAVKPHVSYDLVVYAAARKRMLMINDSPELLPGQFGIIGINFAPMYNFNRYFRAGASLDIQYDESSGLGKYWVEGTCGDDIRFYRPPFFHQVSGGLSVRGELVMPIFSINAGIGYNFVGNSDSRNLYQVLALKVHVSRSLFLHVGYQLNRFRNPNNLMLGIGYRFHNLR